MKNLILCSEQSVLLNKQIDKTVAQLKAKYNDVETEILDFEEMEFSQILVNMTTIPMFCEHKLFIIRNANFLTTEKHNINYDENNFLEFVQNLPDFATFIFCFTTKVDVRKKIVKEMKKHFEMIDFSEITNDKIDEVIIKKADNLNLKITKTDANYLAMQSNYNLAIINNDLEKISLYGESEVIDAAVIDLHCVKSLESNVFALTNKLFTDKKASLRILDDLLSLKEEPLKLLIIISNQMRLLLQVKSYQEKGYASSDIANILKIHPYRVKLALNNSLSVSVLKNSLVNLATYDLRIKKGELTSKQALEFFVLSL